MLWGKKMNIAIEDSQLNIHIRCDELVALWREEKDLIRRTELIAELNAIVKGNDKLKHVCYKPGTQRGRRQTGPSPTLAFPGFYHGGGESVRYPKKAIFSWEDG